MLEIWLPLTEDGKNQGLLESTINMQNITFNNACVFNGVNSNITLSNINLNDDFTICLMINDYNINNANFILGNSIFGVSKTSSNNLEINVNSNTYTAQNLILNLYLHLAIVKKENTISLYKNGALTDQILISSFSNNALFNIGNNGTTQLHGEIYDFRFYSHCLSLKEIQLLSQGLIFHVPLSVPGNPNLLRLSDIAQNDLSNFTIESFRILASKGNGSGYFYIPSTLFEVNHTYTLSFKFKKLNGELLNISLSNVCCSITSLLCDGRNTDSLIEFNNDDKIHNISVTFLYTGNGDYPDFSIYPNYQTNTIVQLSIDQIKLEENNYRSAYVPNENDISFTASGFNSYIIYDVSGFNHTCHLSGGYLNLIFADEFEDMFLDENSDYIISSDDYSISNAEWITNVPRYSGTFMLDNQCIYGNLSLNNIYSISCWVYIAEKESGYILSLNTESDLSDVQVALYIDDLRFNYIVNGVNKQSTTYDLNQWYHLCLTNDGTNIKFYVNGNLMNSSTSGNIIQGNNLTIGARCNNVLNTDYDNYLKGMICDVRIYSTCINDISYLYNIPISIVNNATMTIQGEYIEL